MRRTSVFTKNPTRSSSASSVRAAETLPIGMSVPAPSLVSRADSADCTTMNSVELVCLASSTSPRCRRASMVNSTSSPR